MSWLKKKKEENKPVEIVPTPVEVRPEPQVIQQPPQPVLVQQPMYSPPPVYQQPQPPQKVYVRVEEEFYGALLEELKQIKECVVFLPEMKILLEKQVKQFEEALKE